MRVKNLDYRLILGLGLVVLSIAGVVGLVAAIDRTEAVYVATRPIASGELVTEAMLTVEQMNLGPARERYLRPTGEFRSLRAVRAIGRGELIAKRDVSGGASDAVNTVVTVSGPIPANLVAGSIVDLWAAFEASASGEPEPEPVVLASGIEVVAIRGGEGFAAAETTEVELRLPRGKLSGVIAATARGAYLTIVAVAE